MSDLEALRVAVETVADGGPELDLSDLKALRVCLHTCIGLLAAPRTQWCKTHEVSGWSDDECWKQVWGGDLDYVPAGESCRMVTVVVLEVSE